MKFTVKLGASVALGLVLVVSVVYAATFTHTINSPNVGIWGDNTSGGEWAVLDTNRWAGTTLNDKTYLWVGLGVAGVFTDKAADARAEVEVQRSGEGINKAWMKSSGGAQVEVSESGDVIITLGN